jgi:hypothetical protein
VANSSHGRGEHLATIAVDLWICQIAAGLGFEMEKLVMARRLRRRGDECRFLRESAVILRKGAVTPQSGPLDHGSGGASLLDPRKDGSPGPGATLSILPAA